MKTTAIVIITFNIYDQIFLLQMEAIRKFCKDESFEIHIIDNSRDGAAAESVRYHAERLGLPYQRTQAGTEDSSWSHSFAANVSFQRLKDKYDYFIYLDHDCIPIKDFSVRDILGEKPMAGLAQNKSVTYYWPGCFLWNNEMVDPSLINFSPSSELGLDTGGLLYQAIESVGRDNCIFFDEVICQNPAFSGPDYTHFVMLHNETFMHFINASNWNRLQDNMSRLNSLVNIAREKSGIVQ